MSKKAAAEKKIEPDQSKDLKNRFIKRLAEYLVKDQAKKSIQLEMGSPAAKEWAALRRETPLFGYPTVEEAERTLTEFLG